MSDTTDVPAAAGGHQAPELPPDLGDRLADYLCAMRREADFSQREFAAAAAVPRQTLERLESGATSDPHLSTLSRLASAAGFRLLLCDEENGYALAPMPPRDSDRKDFAGRRLPAHLDSEFVPELMRFWWERRRGEFTFARHRGHRDRGRARRLATFLDDHPEIPRAAIDPNSAGTCRG